MKIELATIQDVPALLDLQRKAFGPLCEELYATGTGESNSMSYLLRSKTAKLGASWAAWI